MRVKLLTTLRGPETTYPPYAIVDLPQDKAQYMIDRRQALPSNEPISWPERPASHVVAPAENTED